MLITDSLSHCFLFWITQLISSDNPCTLTPTFYPHPCPAPQASHVDPYLSNKRGKAPHCCHTAPPLLVQFDLSIVSIESTRSSSKLSIPKKVAEFSLFISDKPPVCPCLTSGKEVSAIVRCKFIQLPNLLVLPWPISIDGQAQKVLVHHADHIVGLIRWYPPLCPFCFRSCVLLSDQFPCCILNMCNLDPIPRVTHCCLGYMFICVLCVA